MKKRPSNTPAPISSRRKLAFTVITLAFPVVAFVTLELALRIINYGPDLSLFLHETIAGKDYLIMNPGVKGRYFAKTTFSPNTSPDYFTVRKAPGTFRIFCLGGSTTVGFPYGFTGSFSSFLRDRLKSLFPEKSIEVVNLGMTATNSYTLLDIAREVMDYEPDLVCVYDGHNEFYGALGVASHESSSASRTLTRVYLRLVHFKTFLLIRDLYWTVTQWFHSSREGEIGGTMMERLARGQYIRFGSAEYRQALENFTANLTDLRSLCRQKGVKLLLASQVSNLRDLHPFVSQDRPEWTAAQKLEFHLLYSKALTHILNREMDSALTLLRATMRFDSLRADVHFDMARCLDSLQMKHDALTEYVKARDLDMLRFRASTDFNDAIKSMEDGQSTFFVDVERKFKANSPDSLIGTNLITEHLHPHERGYFLIAKEFAWQMHLRQILADEQTWNERDHLDDEKLWERRPLTGLDRQCAQRRTALLTSGWPFRDDTKVLPPVDRGDAIGLIAARMVQGELTWEEGHVAAAEYYTQRAQLDDAEREYAVLINQIPLNVSAYLLLGQLYLKQGKNEDAAAVLLQSTGVEPTLFACQVLGKLAVDARDAVPFFEKAFALSVEVKDKVENAFLLGEALFRSGRRDSATVYLHQALVVNPGFTPARSLLNRIEGSGQ